MQGLQHGTDKQPHLFLLLKIRTVIFCIGLVGLSAQGALAWPCLVGARVPNFVLLGVIDYISTEFPCTPSMVRHSCIIPVLHHQLHYLVSLLSVLISSDIFIVRREECQGLLKYVADASPPNHIVNQGGPRPKLRAPQWIITTPQWKWWSIINSTLQKNLTFITLIPKFTSRTLMVASLNLPTTIF